MSDKQEKSIEEILKQKYLTANDLRVLIPKLGYTRALKYLDDAREEMRIKGYFVPEGKTKVALTKVLKAKFGF